MQIVQSEFKLSSDEVNYFHSHGYLGPYTAVSEVEMDRIRTKLDLTLVGTVGPWGGQYQARHLDHRLVYQLCTLPAILDRIGCLLGPDLILWQSNFFEKPPGSETIPWHQDRNFFAIEPSLTVSAWLAIDPATVENSCVQIIPGSHRQAIPHIPTTDYVRFPEHADPSFVQLDQARSMELKPGQFFLFTERLLHHSAANCSQQRRLGLTVRITIPVVRCYKKHPVLVVRGRDYMGFNQLGECPN